MMRARAEAAAASIRTLRSVLLGVVRCVLAGLLLLSSPPARAQSLPALLAVPADLAKAQPALVTRRGALQQERAALHARFDAQTAKCSAVHETDKALVASCAGEGQALTAALASHIRAIEAFNASLQNLSAAAAPAQTRRYRPSGNGMIGGTVWIVGYNVQNADPKLIAKERAMMAQQMQLAGLPYADGVDFDRYNFVLGIAASTDVFTDLSQRVVFDQLKNGQFSVEHQKAYDSLKNRAFGELACHSNGAMICLAALENKDVVADRVVLYGPQVTIESLRLWNELVRSGRVKSVQLYINQGDPVPPVSLLTGRGAGAAVALSTVATFKPPALSRLINETAPRLLLRTMPCGNGMPTLDCHAMTAYRANVAAKPHSSGAIVPGTRSAFPDKGNYVEPPPPR